MSLLMGDVVWGLFGSFQLTVELFDYLDWELKLSESGEEAAGPSQGLLSNSFALWSGMEFQSLRSEAQLLPPPARRSLGSFLSWVPPMMLYRGGCRKTLEEHGGFSPPEQCGALFSERCCSEMGSSLVLVQPC